MWIDGERKPLIGGKDPASKNWNKRGVEGRSKRSSR